MATALEATPRRARGIVAGFTQQGFAAGYMLASGFHLAMGMNSTTTPQHRPDFPTLIAFPDSNS
jgi:hypothetical protein